MGNVDASAIAQSLNAELVGKNIALNKVSSLNNVHKSSLVFSKKDEFEVSIECLILVPYSYKENKNDVYSVIKVRNPRLAFAKVVNAFFVEAVKTGISESSEIGIDCDIDASVAIGQNCTIGQNVIIGRGTIINNNIIINDNTIIGKDCYIKSGTIIGEDGFGFDFEDDGRPVRIPHLGSVIIGNSVEIGAKNTIARGTLENTIIGSDVKIDDQVHIAHNCIVGKNTIITACAEISGSVVIGESCWLGPNCSIMQKVNIGDNVTIGIGSVIAKDIESNKKIMGLESLELRSLIKVKKRIEYGK